MSDTEIVNVIWCECGESVERAGKVTKQTKKYYADALINGRKVEQVTLEDFRKLPFMTCKCLTNHPA